MQIRLHVLYSKVTISVTMKFSKAITYYDQGSQFDPLNYLDQVPEFENSEASTGFWDLTEVITRLRSWYQTCPTITPIMLLRRNDDAQVIRIGQNFGCVFGCSSRGELEELLRNDVPMEQIYWTNSVIPLRDCKYARVAKLNRLQVGRSSALAEIKLGYPEAK